MATGLQTVTNMPYIPSVYGSTSTEYFHPGSGFVTGTFNSSANNGNNKIKRLLALYRKVFSVPKEEPDVARYAYSLFGSKTIAPGTDFHNTFHHGVDISKAKGAQIVSAHAGLLTKATGNTLAIYDKYNNVTYFYLHMDIDSSLKNKTNIDIYVGTPLGKQSNVGLTGTNNEHLHFEVKRGNDNVALMPTTSLTNPLPSLEPYAYIPLL